MNPEVSAIAAGQLGLVTRVQALDAGMTYGEVRSSVRIGLLERVHAGVLRVAGAPRSWEQEVLAACLGAGSPVMASHRAAGVLWGVVERDLEAVEITVPREHGPIPRGVVVHRLCEFRPEDMSRRGAIPVTNPLRTILDLGAVAPHAVRHAVDVATSRRMVSVGGLWRVVEQAGGKGRAGAGVLRAVLEERGVDQTESVMEARFRRILLRAGLRLPVAQYEVRDSGLLVARLDFADPELLLAWELQGYAFHSSYEAVQRDEARRLALTRLGWEVHCFWWKRLVRSPDTVVAEVVEARRRRAPLLGGKTVLG